MLIKSAEQKDYASLIEIWEASVSHTHDFLTQQHIDELKPLILTHYFDAVSLFCCKDNSGKIIGFIGVAGGNIEMLFVEPTFFAKGVGTFLINYAIDNPLHVIKEQQDLIRLQVGEALEGTSQRIATTLERIVRA